MQSHPTRESRPDGSPSLIELFRTDGDISHARSGWTHQGAAATGAVVYLPFEGHYPDKGGRVQSPLFSLRKNDDQPGFYRLTFRAQSAEPCLWWLDYFDANGQNLPDCNSAVHPGSDHRDHDQVVYVPGPTRQVQIAFVSKAPVRAGDVRFTTATAAEAAQWCDALYRGLPPLTFMAPPEAMRQLPKTAAALRNGTPWRAVMLGDSLVNDSFNSLFQALVKRDFPASDVEFVVSVRGSTGCLWYRRPEEFRTYVADLEPDLLMIGGISNFIDFNDDEKAAMAEVIRKAREDVGCETLIMSQPLSADWRKNPLGITDWRQLAKRPEYRRNLDSEFAREVARREQVAFWDLTTPCQYYLAAAGDVSFGRDTVHNNDAGKQVIGRVLQAHFRTAR